MSNYLQKLQNLPQDARKHIMWLATAVIMFSIFIFWLFVLLPKSPAFEHQGENESLSELKGQLQEGVDGFEGIQKQFSEIKEQRQENKKSEEILEEIEELRPRLPLEE